MDSKSNLINEIVWDIEPGALVKVKKHSFTGETYYEYGIVIGQKKVDQIEMFPSVEVYTFETQAVSRQVPSAIEILSRPSDEENKNTMD